MWNNGKKCAVVLGFCFDAESMWTGSLGLSSPAYLARGEYGARVGVPRVLSMLDKYKIRATFYIPGDSVDRHPDEVKEIHASTKCFISCTGKNRDPGIIVISKLAPCFIKSMPQFNAYRIHSFRSVDCNRYNLVLLLIK